MADADECPRENWGCCRDEYGTLVSRGPSLVWAHRPSDFNKALLSWPFSRFTISVLCAILISVVCISLSANIRLLTPIFLDARTYLVIWGAAEPAVSIVAASIPALRALVADAAGTYFRSKDHNTTGTAQSWTDTRYGRGGVRMTVLTTSRSANDTISSHDTVHPPPREVPLGLCGDARTSVRLGQ